MFFRSKSKGSRLSQVYISFETKEDIYIKEKYNYCLEECLVIDTIVKDMYSSI